MSLQIIRSTIPLPLPNYKTHPDRKEQAIVKTENCAQTEETFLQITQCKSKILQGYENYISNKIDIFTLRLLLFYSGVPNKRVAHLLILEKFFFPSHSY